MAAAQAPDLVGSGFLLRNIRVRDRNRPTWRRNLDGFHQLPTVFGKRFGLGRETRACLSRRFRSSHDTSQFHLHSQLRLIRHRAREPPNEYALDLSAARLSQVSHSVMGVGFTVGREADPLIE